MAKVRVNVSLEQDTHDRLKQYAFENHTTVSAAITDWIWAQKVKNENFMGQMSILDKPKKRRKKSDDDQ